MTEDKKMITDMNDRERERFITSFKMLEAYTGALISALESGDDSALAGPATMFFIAITGVQDLFKVLATAQWIDVSDLERPMPDE